MKILNDFIIILIKTYQYLISPILGSNCRYQPTCSNYFIDCIKINGAFRGSLLGAKRILSCHPIKIFGGGHGFDPAPKIKQKK